MTFRLRKSSSMLKYRKKVKDGEEGEESAAEGKQ